MRRVVAVLFAAVLLPAPVMAQSPSPAPTVLRCVELRGPVPNDLPALLAGLASGSITIVGLSFPGQCVPPDPVPAPSAAPAVPLTVGETATTESATVTLDEVRFVKGKRGTMIALHVTYSAGEAFEGSWQLFVGDQVVPWDMDPMPKGLGPRLPQTGVPAGRAVAGWVPFTTRARPGQVVAIYGPDGSQWSITCCTDVP